MGTASLAVIAEPIAVKTAPEFDDLYDRYSDAVYRTAVRVAGNPADAEDVLQNVFLRVLNNRLAIDPARSPEPYLRRAATNAAIDLLRRKQARPDSGQATDAGSGDGASIESSALLKERLRQALTKLAPEDSELFVLCYLEGYSYDELAELTGLEQGTVASRLHRIRTALRNELSK